MPIKFIVSGFLAVVVTLVGIGVWGWYASDDSRAEVERIRAERKRLIFCEDYRAVQDLAEYRFGIPAQSPPVVLGPGGQPIPEDSVGIPSTDDPFAHEPYVEHYYLDMERFVRNAPPAVADDVAVVAEADEDAMRYGNSGPYERPEVVAAVERIVEYGDRTCG